MGLTATTRPHSLVHVRAREAVPGFTSPDWVKDAIFYQIFPDRFANGNPANDPAGTHTWGAQPTTDAFQGGDLEGITSKLGYLKDLGVTGIYMNPVFTAPSNHKYDTADYKNVDPHFGGNDALKGLVDGAHGSGMRVVLDGVFNHTGNTHGWFQDVVKNGEKSKYWDFYSVQRWPITTRLDEKHILRSDDYVSWWGFATLPELRTDTAAVQKALLTDKTAVVKHWIDKYHVDGWRMDVADEVPISFWKEARKQIKSTNPNAYIVAENWHDAGDLLHGDTFDGAMNYQYFRDPAVKFFAHKSISADEFAHQLSNTYPTQAKQAMFNVLDSHDTKRFITEAGGDWYRQRVAAIFQMTYVGAPVIYYGDEIGMQGGLDPDSRRAFEWDPHKQNGKLHGLYKKLIDVRKSEPSLRRGEFEMLTTHNDNKTISFRRFVPGTGRDAIVALNNDVTDQNVDIPVGSFAADGTIYTDALSGKDFAVKNGALHVNNIDGNFGSILLRKDAPIHKR